MMGRTWKKLSVGVFASALMASVGAGLLTTPAFATYSSSVIAPSNVIATPGDTTVSVSWTGPTSGTTPTSYDVFVGSSAGGENYATPACTATGTSCSVSGLVDSTTYYFTVETEAGSLNSAASAEVTAVPRTAPLAPTSPVVTGAASSLVVSWTAPTSGTTPTSYAVYVGTSSGAENYSSAGCSTTTTTCTVTGLANNRQYFVTVESVYGSLQSSASSQAVATTPTVPTAPVTPTVSLVANVAHNSLGEVTVSWTAPANGGSALTGYTVASTPTVVVPAACSTLLTGTSTSCVFSGLIVGTTYTFNVTAKNAVGSSSPSPQSAPIEALTVSLAPTGLSASSSSQGQSSESWTAPLPASTGGSPITGYLVTAADLTKSSGNATCSTTGATACTVTGLVNGNVYSFSVAAINADGTSLGSIPVIMPGSVTETFAVGRTVLTTKAKQALSSYAVDLSTGASLTITGYAHHNSFLAKSRAVTAALYLQSLVGPLHFTFHEITSSQASAVTVVTVANVTNSSASTVSFIPGSIVLSTVDKAILVAAAQSISSGSTVKVVGYAPSNTFLAKSRATAVALYFEKQLTNVRFTLSEVTNATTNIATFSVATTP